MTKPEKHRKLQDESKRQEVLTALKLGCSLVAAAKLVNCSPTTIRRETQLDADFEERYKQARGQSERQYLQRIFDAAGKPQYWRAAAWALERRFPRFYAPRSPDVITLNQITILIAKIAQIIEEEITAPTLRKKVLKGLDSITTELRKEQLSTQLEISRNSDTRQDTPQTPEIAGPDTRT